MKTLFLILTILPIVATAQENTSHSMKAKSYNTKYEAGLNTSVALSLKKGMTFYDNAFLVARNNISLYRNFSTSQIGLRIEGGYDPSEESWILSPEFVANKCINFKHMYLYAGAGLGYKRIERSFLIHSVSNGYTTALQTGIVYRLGKHISINAELSIKSEQMWIETPYLTPQHGEGGTKTSYFDIYSPISLGLRYRF